MAEIIIDLENALRSSREGLTSQEARVLEKCKVKILKHVGVGGAVGGAVSWLATRQSGFKWRHGLLLITGYLTARWSFLRSLNPCIEDMLSLEGSRIQKELANIMVTKYVNHPSTLRFIPRHFFLEEVISDSSIDKPILRYRSRNTWYDNLANNQGTQDNNFHSVKANSDNVDVPQFPVNQGLNIFADPFDCVFGIPERKEEIHPASAPTTSSRRSRRAHRRHRMENK